MHSLLLSLVAGLALSNTFHVDDVKKEAADYQLMSLGEKMGLYQALDSSLVEAVSNTQLIKSDELPTELGMNGLLEAVHLAYSQHHGLTLSPEKLFIAVLQGVAIHINQDPEKHRASLGIQHEGKLALEVRDDSLRIGSEANHWQRVFNAFKKEIGGHLPEDLFSELAKPFSTSTDLSVAVTSVTIMDSFKAYFEYTLTTMCGIPEVTLQGTPEDWIDLKTRAQSLLQRIEGLGKWEATLIPVLDQFVLAAQGAPNHKFWKRIYKLDGVSGNPDVSGWINAFFPYHQHPSGFQINRCAHQQLRDCPKYSLDFYPVGFTRTPFQWKYCDATYEMEFVGGLVGVEKNATTNHVQPALGWAVLYKTKPTGEIPYCFAN